MASPLHELRMWSLWQSQYLPFRRSEIEEEIEGEGNGRQVGCMEGQGAVEYR